MDMFHTCLGESLGEFLVERILVVCALTEVIDFLRAADGG